MTRDSTDPSNCAYAGLRRAAHHLENLASLGQLVVFLLWIVATVALFSDTGSQLISPSSVGMWAESLRAEQEKTATAILLIPLVLAPLALAAIWLLSRLHALARALHREEPISNVVALALLRLARAILWYLLVATFFPALLAALLGASGFPLTLDFGTWYLGVIAYLCLRAMSLLVAEASRISDENRAFV